MLDQGLLRTLFILFGEAHSESVAAEQCLNCIRIARQKRLSCKKQMLRIVLGHLFLRIDQFVAALSGKKLLGCRKDTYIELARLHGSQSRRRWSRLNDLHVPRRIESVYG